MTIYSRIAGTGSYLPEKILTNADLEKMVDTDDQWIRERTGIEERHIAAEGETTSYMGFIAAQRAMEAAGVTAADLDLIILGTTTPDFIFPSSACLIQEKLGALGIPAFDVNAACSGFVFALGIADKFIKSGSVKTALVVGSETLTRMVDWTDRKTCVLFGDGAGAAVVSAAKDPSLAILDFAHEVDGSGAPFLQMPAGGSLRPATHETVEQRLHYIKQDGQAVFKFAVRKTEEISRLIMQRNNLTPDDIDLFVSHQANMRIIKAAGERLGFPECKVMINLQRYGNTTAATIPLALTDALAEGRIKKGSLVLLASVGAGFTVGSVLLRWAY